MTDKDSSKLELILKSFISLSLILALKKRDQFLQTIVLIDLL